jgi:hypothetical protein
VEKKKKFEENFGEKNKKFLKKKNFGKAVLATFEIDQIYCTVASHTTSYQCEEPNDESPSLLLNVNDDTAIIYETVQIHQFVNILRIIEPSYGIQSKRTNLGRFFPWVLIFFPKKKSAQKKPTTKKNPSWKLRWNFLTSSAHNIPISFVRPGQIVDNPLYYSYLLILCSITQSLS